MTSGNKIVSRTHKRDGNKDETHVTVSVNMQPSKILP